MALGHDVAKEWSDAQGAGSIRVLWEASAAHLAAYGIIGEGGRPNLRHSLAELMAALKEAPTGYSIAVASGIAVSSGEETRATTRRFTSPADRRNFAVGRPEIKALRPLGET